MITLQTLKIRPVLFFCSVIVGFSHGGLETARFHYGTPYSNNVPSEIDYVSQWAGSGEDYNMGSMMRACAPGGPLEGVTPVVYSYIIAFTLRRDHDLQDCNVGSPSLCDSGAFYIRNPVDRARILGQVSKYAQGTAGDLGTGVPVVWLMEPDFYQYAQSGTQGGEPLSFSEAAAFMHEMLDTIQTYLPEAIFSLDISPWTAYNETVNRNWYTSFDLDRFTYMHTSGGGTNAEGPEGTTQIRGDPMTWKSIYELTGKPILADDGYGVAGASTGHDDTWDNPDNLNARIADGVIGINQANPRADWNAIISATRPLLDIPSDIPNITSLWTRPQQPKNSTLRFHNGYLIFLPGEGYWEFRDYRGRKAN